MTEFQGTEFISKAQQIFDALGQVHSQQLILTSVCMGVFVCCLGVLFFCVVAGLRRS